MGISLKVAVVAAVMAVMFLGAVAWLGLQLVGGTDPEEAASSTVVFGDSITTLSADEIVAETGADVVAYNGAKWVDVGPAVERTLAEADDPPERAGVLLGTNDVLDLTMGLTDFDAVLDPLEAVPCVVVLELPKTVGGLSRGFNDAMRTEVARRPDMVTDDGWSGLATRNLERNAGSWFDEDKVHPNATGQRELAKSYASALDRHCGQASG